jgi:AcrR family transcriptional regulator
MTALTSDGKITTNTRWGTSKNADAREARDRILDAASRCFDRAGVPKTTMRDVGAEAKVTRTTLYRYFENREAVVVGVMLRETHHFRERILEALKDIDDVGEFIVEGILFCLREAPKRQLHILLFGGEASNLMGRLFLSSEQLFEIGIELLRPLFEPAREKGLLRDGGKARNRRHSSATSRFRNAASDPNRRPNANEFLGHDTRTSGRNVYPSRRRWYARMLPGDRGSSHRERSNHLRGLVMQDDSAVHSWIAAFLSLLLAAPAVAEPLDLRSSERSVFSQFGEDGVIERLFEIIEPGPKYAVEFGASDGVKASNTRNLIVSHGWSALLIEGNAKRAARMIKTYEGMPKVTAIQAWVYPGNIEILFEDHGVPVDLDLLVIDIDSNDYYVWRAIHSFQPKIVQVEANPAFPPPQQMVVDFHPMNYWDGSDYHGASAQTWYNLAKKKGYELVHHSSRGNNLFFVRKEYYDRFGIEDNSPAKIYTPVKAMEKRKNAPPYLRMRARKIPKKYIHDR